MVSTLVKIYFGRPRLEHTIKTNFTTFQTADPEICLMLSFIKVFGTLYKYRVFIGKHFVSIFLFF